MTGPQENDLCSRCVYAADCAARQKSSGPVLCCDRYRGLNGADRGGPEPARPASLATAVPKAAGLCRTCTKRERCSRRNAEGGVWRCPDYV